MHRTTRLLTRLAVPIFLAASVFSVGGFYYSAKLYKNLRTDLEELLPTSARSVLDLNEVRSRLESIDNLSVLVFSDDAANSRRFVEDLAAKLNAEPKDVIASVEYNIAKELDFFKARRALYIDLPDLKRIRDYVRNRLEYEKIIRNPLTIFAGVNVDEPSLDFHAIEKKYAGQTSNYDKFPDGYYATPDEKKRVLLVYKPSNGSGDKLKKAVVKAIAELDPKKNYAKDLEIEYAGGVQNTIEEQAALVEDLELSTVLVAILVAAAMVVFYRAVRASTALLIALFYGTFWTFGAAYFAVGYLNANSAFLGSIVLGNGINFPIILLARYLEERRNHLDHETALDVSITHTASATWTAALAAGLSYGSLALTGFRGFKQFGIIGLIGMVLCWISTFTVMPALLTIFDRFRTLEPKRAKPKSWVAGSIAHLVSKFPGTIAWISVALTLFSGAMLFRYNSSIIETDLSKLRNKYSIEHGSGYYSKYVDEIFGRYLSPMVALPHDRAHAAILAEKYKAKMKADGPTSLIHNVSILDDFVPKDQPEKIKILREISRLLPPSIRAQLDPKEAKLVSDFIRPETFKPIAVTDLPALVLGKFTEKDGSIGKLVLIEPPLNTVTNDGDNLISFVHSLREIADSVAPGTPVAGSLPISSDMIESINRDGPRATLFAFSAVVLLVIVLFRRPRVFAPVLLALFLGVLWLVGAVLAYWFKINFLNFIALPITFGIGVDYGVNVFSRYREERGADILKVIRDTGGAVVLCSFTTTVGYGSLLIASNQAFVSFGLLAVLGEMTCVAAAMFALPAILIVMKNRKERKNPAWKPELSPDSRRPENTL
ncbi:MAG: MMPL family transporter [Bdellovibrionales bacterium]|nr:MMPL family transporter [Bdellovibrionales bacterium]